MSVRVNPGLYARCIEASLPPLSLLGVGTGVKTKLESANYSLAFGRLPVAEIQAQELYLRSMDPAKFSDSGPPSPAPDHTRTRRSGPSLQPFSLFFSSKRLLMLNLCTMEIWDSPPPSYLGLTRGRVCCWRDASGIIRRVR